MKRLVSSGSKTVNQLFLVDLFWMAYTIHVCLPACLGDTYACQYVMQESCKAMAWFKDA